MAGESETTSQRCRRAPLPVTYDSPYAQAKDNLSQLETMSNKVVWNTTIYRKLCLITLWPHCKIKKLKDSRNLLAAVVVQIEEKVTILKDLLASQKKQKVPSNHLIELPDDDDVEVVIQGHTTGSPKLRQLLAVLAESVVLFQEKVMIWANLPAQMQT